MTKEQVLQIAIDAICTTLKAIAEKPNATARTVYDELKSAYDCIGSATAKEGGDAKVTYDLYSQPQIVQEGGRVGTEEVDWALIECIANGIGSINRARKSRGLAQAILANKREIKAGETAFNEYAELTESNTGDIADLRKRVEELEKKWSTVTVAFTNRELTETEKQHGMELEWELDHPPEPEGGTIDKLVDAMRATYEPDDQSQEGKLVWWKGGRVAVMQASEKGANYIDRLVHQDEIVELKKAKEALGRIWTACAEPKKMAKKALESIGNRVTIRRGDE